MPPSSSHQPVIPPFGFHSAGAVLAVVVLTLGPIDHALPHLRQQAADPRIHPHSCRGSQERVASGVHPTLAVHGGREESTGRAKRLPPALPRPDDLLKFRRHRRNCAFLPSRTRGTKCLTAHRTGTGAALRCRQTSPAERERNVRTATGEACRRHWAWSSLRSGTCSPQVSWSGRYRQSDPAWGYPSGLNIFFRESQGQRSVPVLLAEGIVSLLQRNTAVEGLDATKPHHQRLSGHA